MCLSILCALCSYPTCPMCPMPYLLCVLQYSTHLTCLYVLYLPYLCYVPCLPLLLTRSICLACLTCSTCFTQLTYLRCVTCRFGLLAFHTLCTLRASSALSLFVILFTMKETTLRFLDRSIENRTKIKWRRKTLIYFLLKLANNYFCMICQGFCFFFKKKKSKTCFDHIMMQLICFICLKFVKI